MRAQYTAQDALSCVQASRCSTESPCSCRESPAVLHKMPRLVCKLSCAASKSPCSCLTGAVPQSACLCLSGRPRHQQAPGVAGGQGHHCGALPCTLLLSTQGCKLSVLTAGVQANKPPAKKAKGPTVYFVKGKSAELTQANLDTEVRARAGWQDCLLAVQAGRASIWSPCCRCCGETLRPHWTPWHRCPRP